MTTTRSDLTVSGLAGLLAWYRENGVDCALDDQPTDWLARGDSAPGEDFHWRAASGTGPSPAPVEAAPVNPRTAAPHPATIASNAPLRTLPGVSGPGAEVQARAAAQAANSLAELVSAIERFDGCALKATATKTCVYRGAETARIMIIGEAPGRDEDLAGRPFVGRAGALLDKMLAAIPLGADDVHITNAVYWRPPGNRTPTPQEANACRPFLERQAELVAPEIVVALGGTAAKHLFGDAEGIMRLRGKWRQITLGNHSVRAIATLHPAYLLRTPIAKRLVWRDLLSIKSCLFP